MSMELLKRYGFHYVGSPSHLDYALAMGRLDNLIKKHIHDEKIMFDYYIIRPSVDPQYIGETTAMVSDENDLKNAKEWMARSTKEIPSYDMVAIKFKRR